MLLPFRTATEFLQQWITTKVPVALKANKQMFPQFTETKEELERFRFSLSADEQTHFRQSMLKTRNLVNLYSATLDLDSLIEPSRYNQLYYSCLNTCYSTQRPEDIQGLQFEPLQNCVSRCQRTKQKYKQKSLDIYYMSLLSYRKKISNCFRKFDGVSEDFLNCEWTGLNKIRRRYSNWWDRRLDEIAAQFES